MTLDEAIKHAEEKAEEQQLRADNWTKEWDNGFVNYCNKCAEEHRQLAEWLKELKKYREQTKINHNSTENNDNDLVSRKAVIDMMNKIFFDNDFSEFRVEYGSQGAMYYAINYVKELPTIIEADKEYKAEVITRGNCMMCGKELTEGLFLCKECGDKVNKESEEEE